MKSDRFFGFVCSRTISPASILVAIAVAAVIVTSVDARKPQEHAPAQHSSPRTPRFSIGPRRLAVNTASFAKARTVELSPRLPGVRPR